MNFNTKFKLVFFVFLINKIQKIQVSEITKTSFKQQKQFINSKLTEHVVKQQEILKTSGNVFLIKTNKAVKTLPAPTANVHAASGLVKPSEVTERTEIFTNLSRSKFSNKARHLKEPGTTAHIWLFAQTLKIKIFF